MRFKLLPEAPATLEAVREAQQAIPLVPGTESDCCARLQRRCGFPSRDVARTWLTFLRALALAEETPSGFRRRREDPTPDHLREAFLENVFLADDVLRKLVDSDGPVTADEVFPDVREDVPTWEHHKNPDTWQDIWRDRIAEQLAWFELLGLADRVADGYVATDIARSARENVESSQEDP